jgi:hypothetical protein
MPADVTADLNLFDTQVSSLISVASVIVAATAASTTQPMVDNLSTALQAINATRARIIRGRQQP